jgi:hypothetical protein
MVLFNFVAHTVYIKFYLCKYVMKCVENCRIVVKFEGNCNGNDAHNS